MHVEKWFYRTEYRFVKHCYDRIDMRPGSETEQRLIDSLLASCDVSNTTEAIRAIAILAIAIQWIASHVSKVTNHVIKNKPMYSRGQNWVLRDEVNESCNFQHQFKKMHQLMTGMITIFKEYSTNELHPYFKHGDKLIPLQEQIRVLALESTGFWRPPYNQEEDEVVRGLGFGLDDVEVKSSVWHDALKQYHDGFLPKLWSLTVSLRELVLVFGDNGQYSRSVTLEIVKRFPPESKKRHQAILRLEQEGRAGKSTVYQQLKSESELNMIIYDEGKRFQRQQPINDMSHQGCPGHILLDLCPVQTTLNEISNPNWMRAKKCQFETAHVTMGLFSPKCHDLYYISVGSCKDDRVRYYFCPRRFPPPYDANKMWDCDSFNRLKWYIRHCSEKAKSPVYCNGGKGGKTRRFRCNRKNIDGKGCKFAFSVFCDLVHGYYINFHDFSGCPVNHLKHDLHKSHRTCNVATNN